MLKVGPTPAPSSQPLAPSPHFRPISMLILDGAHLVLPDRILSPGRLVIDADRIVDRIVTTCHYLTERRGVASTTLADCSRELSSRRGEPAARPYTAP